METRDRKTQISVRVKTPELERLRAMAKQSRRTLSSLVDEAIESYLEGRPHVEPQVVQAFASEFPEVILTPGHLKCIAFWASTAESAGQSLSLKQLVENAKALYSIIQPYRE